ncbi:DUF2855 family protein [Ramlibacter henchirensis]|uniref:DUF2855 family protein n=1 Tax=Ramlibacter henchirensis TaxID=204072 RepID=A0A4Z0C7V7_9BURK|nr:DUF2855 family protein [Ramlibacter henchirensis]TFZ06520.1 DUF2855 family protein [Ramlibacter henchirensis]
MTTTLLIRKDRLDDTRLRTDTDAALAQGQVRVAPDLLALTANNITYAAFGDSMDYWRFFPSGEEGWGVLPVWGFGRVAQSMHPGVAVGERLWGYWPLADSAILSPDRLTAAGFRDAAPHRSGLHAVYNRYARCNQDPFWREDTEAAQALLRPLFSTSWLIDDFMADNGFFGARRLLLSSASSKTAYGTAHRLALRGGIEVIGLTSSAHRGFCEGLGCYSRVLAYEALEEVPAREPCVYIDFAGNTDLRRRIHERFGNQLRYSCAVGGTHVDRLGGGAGLPGPRPELFFAPAQAKKRQSEWGEQELQQRILTGWNDFLQRVLGSEPWLRVEQHRGMQDAQATYAQMLSGRADPAVGHVLRPR